MPLAIVRTRALTGLQAPEVRVEVHVGNGLPAFHIVGLPQAAVRESADRVRAALLNCGFEFPNRRLTVNLAPADLPKDSGRFDLPIAVGILAASGQIPVEDLDALEFVGELSLTGELRPIRGVLAMLLALCGGRGNGGRGDGAGAGDRRLVVPSGCRDEAALAPGRAALAATDLVAVCAHLRGTQPLERVEHHLPDPDPASLPDLADVRGHAVAKRALTIAAAGRHSLLMTGPPGAGKSMLAVRLPGLLPPLDTEQALQCAAIRSIAGRFDPAHWGARPFRSPHHTASAVALVGGGSGPRPGEVSLAHQGVLFLDELPEFPRHTLDALREPLESGEITISRAARQATFPARVQLVAAMNPCPCGHAGASTGRCRCSAPQILRYQQSVSGPLLDRIDLRVQVEPVPLHELAGRDLTECSATVRARVAQATQRQMSRQGCANALLDSRGVERHCRTEPDALRLLHEAARRLGWSGRAYHRVLRVARTIADLAGIGPIGTAHLAEAIQYRQTLVHNPRDPVPA